MIMTTYPRIPERPVTRSEIERLTSIIAQLNDALDASADREDALRHELDLQIARAAIVKEGHRNGCPVGAARALDA